MYSQIENGVATLDIPVRNSLTFNRFLVHPTFSFVREQNKYITATNKRELLAIEDAPQTYLLNYSGRFRENIGAGIALFQQTNGVLTTFGGILNLAYNVRFDDESNFTFGLNVAAYQSGLNSGSVITNFDDPLLNNIPSNFLITVHPGINYGTGLFDFGLSLNNLVTYNFNSSQMINDNPKQGFQGHVMYTGYLGGFGFFADSKFTALGRGEILQDTSIFSGVAMLTVPKGIWAQVGYNTLYGASGGLGINITPQIGIEYNYEKPFMGLSDLGSAHEITLVYKFKNDNYYDYSRDDELAGIFNLENTPQRKKTKKKAATVKTDVVIASTPTPEPKEVEVNEEELTRIAAAEQKRKETEEQTRIAAEELSRKEAEAQVALEEQKRLDTEKQVRIAAEEQKRLEAEALTRVAAVEQTRLEAEALTRIAAAEQTRLEAEALTRVAAVEQTRLEAEALARVAAIEQTRLDAEALAKVIAAEQIRLAAEEQAKLDEELLIKNPTDAVGQSLSNLSEDTVESSKTQAEVLEQLQIAVAEKEKDLRDLKEENDLSEQGIFIAPKPFKSISAENKKIEEIKIALDTIILKQKKKIAEMESLLITRVRSVNDRNDATNSYYKNTLDALKQKQKETIQYRASLVSTLETIKIATEIERKRRIKRAAFDNEQDRFEKDRALMTKLRQNTDSNQELLTKDNFDFGIGQSTSIEILKNVQNTESAYYLILAVHSNVNGRNTFLENVIASGYRDVDFFYDVNTTKYYIYYNKYDTIEEANNSIKNIENRPYADKISLIKIEN
jgi:type IX secretion system PorP/SprF family membrane protein